MDMKRSMCVELERPSQGEVRCRLDKALAGSGLGAELCTAYLGDVLVGSSLQQRSI
jgi:hypothetical protein